MAEAREFVRKMNIVSTKDREDKADDASNDANKNVRIVCDIIDAFFWLELLPLQVWVRARHHLVFAQTAGVT
jgi:hypothetical protein